MKQRPLWMVGNIVQKDGCPPDLAWECSVCGPQPPMALSGNRWVKRTCACQRRARRAALQQQENWKEPTQGTGGAVAPLTHLGTILPAQKSPAMPPPPELCWTCRVCGPVPPLYLSTGRWIKRSCACQRQARQRREQEDRHSAWLTSQRTRTFGGWMGSRWVDPEVISAMSRKTFDRYDGSYQLEAFEKALAFAHQPKGNLLFHGDYGTGKTHLSAAICNHLREVGRDLPDGKQERMTSLFVSAPQFFLAYEETRRAGDQTAHIRLMSQVMSTPLLVLDDIDKSRPTEARIETYWLIFDERCKAKRPTVLSTNKREELDGSIGAASVSRLSRGLVAVEMRGDDYRREEEG